MKRFVVRTVLCTALLLSGTCLCSEGANPAEKTGRWTFSMSDSGADLQKVSAERQKMIRAQFQEIVKIITATPVMQQPRGFEARFWGTTAAKDRFDICSGKNCLPHRPTAALALMIGRYEVKNGKLRAAFNTPSTMDISVNNLGHVFAYLPVLYNDAAGYLFPEPVPAGERAGMPTFLNNGHAVAVIADNNRPLWLPVSRERYLRAAIANASKELRGPGLPVSIDNKLLMVEESKTWLDPAGEKVRIEKSRSLAGGFKESPENLQARLLKLQAELDALPSDQRGLPARIEFHSGENGQVPVLLPPESSAGTAVVTPNFDYFNRKLSPEAIQLLVVQWKFDGDPLYDPDSSGIAETLNNRVLLEICKTLNWKKLQAKVTRTGP